MKNKNLSALYIAALIALLCIGLLGYSIGTRTAYNRYVQQPFEIAPVEINTAGFKTVEWDMKDWNNIDTVVIKLMEDGKYGYYRMVVINSRATFTHTASPKP